MDSLVWFRNFVCRYGVEDAERVFERVLRELGFRDCDVIINECAWRFGKFRICGLRELVNTRVEVLDSCGGVLLLDVGGEARVASCRLLEGLEVEEVIK